MKPSARSKIVLALLGLILLTGCGARHIREAQQSFDTAAREENRLSPASDTAYVSNPGLNLHSPTTSLANYKIAVSLLEKELAENRAELDKDKLTGTAVTLKCMALWRIADLEPVADAKPPEKAPDQKAKDCANEADSGKHVLGTRDRVLLKAIPAFVDADIGRRQTTYAEAKKYFIDSYTVVKNILAEPLPPDHDIRIYLRLTQIRTLAAWRGAMAKLPQPERKTEIAATTPLLVDEYCTLAPYFQTRPGLKKFLEAELVATAAWPLENGACAGRVPPA